MTLDTISELLFTHSKNCRPGQLSLFAFPPPSVTGHWFRVNAPPGAEIPHLLRYVVKKSKRLYKAKKFLRKKTYFNQTNSIYVVNFK